MVAMLLIGKHPKAVRIQQQLELETAMQITDIVEKLVEDNDKIKPAMIYVSKSDLAMAGMTKRKTDAETLQDLAKESFDNEKIKCLGDVPPVWLYGLFNKISKVPVTDEIVRRVTCRSSLNLRHMVTLFTGS